MEISYEEEMINQNLKSDSPKAIDIGPPKVITVYPWDDEEIHITYIVKPEDFQRAYGTLAAAYDKWSINCWEEDWGYDELSDMCDAALDEIDIFKIKFAYGSNEADPFKMDEMIG